jgi:hypothetical protein
VTRTKDFPVREVGVLVVAAVPAFAVSLLCLERVVGYSGPQFDHVILNGHVLGGTHDRLALMAVGTVCGAAVVFCVLRIRSHYMEWRRGRHDSFAS